MIFKINIIVTPGIPDTPAMPKLKRLTGNVTPVNVPDILTIANVAIPVNIPLKVFLIGFLERINI